MLVKYWYINNFNFLISIKYKKVKSGESFNEAIFKTAFGTEGLGMPLRGFRHNIGNLSAYTL
jgi:hypothetical protein